MRYIFILLLFIACTAKKSTLTGSELCEAPRKEIAQSAPVNTLFCRHSKNLKINMDVSSLWLAVLNKDIAWVKYEVERGADVNLGDSLIDEPPLHGAAEDGSKDIVAYLLEHGANPNKPRSNNGKTEASNGATALSMATSRNNSEIVGLLLEHGADPNIARSDNGLTGASDGSTPLVMAADMGYTKIVKLLLEYGADPDIGSSNNGKTVGADGSTPLLMAATYGKVDAVKLLLDYGANPDIAPRGMTPLMLAAVVKGPNSAEIVRMLLDAGATVNMKDKALGFTALDFAKSSGNATVAEILEEYVGK